MHPLNIHSKPQPRELTLDDIKHMPKAELHLHLDGSIRPRTVIELALEQGVELETFDEEKLTKILTVPEDCPSLVEYLRSFDVTAKVLQCPYALTRCVYEICEDAYHDGVSYIEIRFAPILHTNRRHTLSEIMHAVIEGRLMAEKAFPITCRIIVCAMRQLSPAESLNAAEVAYRYQHQGVVALDVAGPENGFMPDKHKEAFALAREKGLCVTIHAGEAAGWKSIDHAIRHCGAQRLGHGVALRDKPELLERVINTGIAVESCPTSNFQTKAVKSMAEHPIKDFFDRGVIIFPCTDNVTVSGVTLSSEYLRVYKEKKFTLEELVFMMDYSFRSGFVSYTHRTRLRISAMQTTLTYLQSQGFDISGLLEDLPIYDPIFYAIMPKQTVPRLYWDKYVNPQITPEIIRQLPKVDLQVRLVGSMSLDTLWDLSEAEGEKNNLIKDTKNKETMLLLFKNMARNINEATAAGPIGNPPRPRLTVQQARRYMLDVLQTKEQLERCLDDTYRVCKEDGIVYFELMIRPLDHCAKDLTEDEVVAILTAKKPELEKKYNIRSSFFLSCRVPDDDPLQFMETAHRIKKFREQGVLGFSTFGGDITEEMMQYYIKTFWFLKEQNIPTVISTARTNPQSVIPAVIDGGAIRISGGYTVEEQPQIVKFLCDRQIAVDLSVTGHMQEHSKHMHSFAGNVIRFLIDNDIRVLLCSIGRNLETYHNLVDNITHVVADCGIGVHELIHLLSLSFRCTALPLAEREKLYRECIDKSTEILESSGFRHFRKKVLLPDYSIPFPDPHPLLKTDPSTSRAVSGSSVFTPAGEEIRIEGGSSMMVVSGDLS